MIGDEGFLVDSNSKSNFEISGEEQAAIA